MFTNNNLSLLHAFVIIKISKKLFLLRRADVYLIHFFLKYTIWERERTQAVCLMFKHNPLTEIVCFSHKHVSLRILF